MVSVDVEHHVYFLRGPLESDDAFHQTFGPLGDQVTFQTTEKLLLSPIFTFWSSDHMLLSSFLNSFLFLQHRVGKANEGGVATWRYPG